MKNAMIHPEYNFTNEFVEVVAASLINEDGSLKTVHKVDLDFSAGEVPMDIRVVLGQQFNNLTSCTAKLGTNADDDFYMQAKDLLLSAAGGLSVQPESFFEMPEDNKIILTIEAAGAVPTAGKLRCHVTPGVKRPTSYAFPKVTLAD